MLLLPFLLGQESIANRMVRAVLGHDFLTYDNDNDPFEIAFPRVVDEMESSKHLDRPT